MAEESTGEWAQARYEAARGLDSRLSHHWRQAECLDESGVKEASSFGQPPVLAGRVDSQSLLRQGNR
eukprot:777671-Pleurochrysis_carterae.AAC.3